MSRSVLSLIYHDIAGRERRDEVGFPGPVAGVYKLDPDHFAGHVRAIAASGIEISADPASAGAMLTFDDGGQSAHVAAAQLEQHGMRGAFFVVTSRLGTPGFLTADGVRELAASGHLVGSHSHTHPSYMRRLSVPQLAEEWSRSRDVLGEVLGHAPVSAAVPGGSVSPPVLDAAGRAGYRYVFTSTPWARVSVHGGMAVIGRFTMWAGDSPDLAAAIIAGRVLPRAQRLLSWQVKSGAKRISPRLYERLRAGRARSA